MRQELIERNAHVGLVEAMLFEDDATVEKMLRRGKSGRARALGEAKWSRLRVTSPLRALATARLKAMPSA